MSWELRLGDCIQGMAAMPDKSVDHVIADPPFESEAHTLQRRTKETFDRRSIAGVDVRGTAVKPIGFDAITPEVRRAAAAQMARVARRWVLVFCQAEAVGTWRDEMVAAGLSWRRSCVWVKPDGQPQLSGDRPGMGYESIACAHAPGCSTWNGGGKHGVFVFHKTGDTRTGHDTQKPLALMESLVRDFTDPGDLICDPFAGSGTTGVAAIRLGRRFIGWERDPKYHAIATKRLSAAREQLRMFDPEPPARPHHVESVGEPDRPKTVLAAARGSASKRVTIELPDGTTWGGSGTQGVTG